MSNYTIIQNYIMNSYDFIINTTNYNQCSKLNNNKCNKCSELFTTRTIRGYVLLCHVDFGTGPNCRILLKNNRGEPFFGVSGNSCKSTV